MAITFIDGGTTIRFDSGWELVLVFVVAYVVGACMGALLTVYRPALADRLFVHAVATAVAAGRLIKSLFVVPTGVGWGVVVA